MDITQSSSTATQYSATPAEIAVALPNLKATVIDGEVTIWPELNGLRSWGSIRMNALLFPEFLAFLADIATDLDDLDPEELVAKGA